MSCSARRPPKGRGAEDRRWPAAAPGTLDHLHGRAFHGPHHGRRPGHSDAVGHSQGSASGLRQAHGRVGRRRRRGRPVPTGSSASCGPATASPRGCRTASRSPSSTRARAPAPRCSPRARPWSRGTARSWSCPATIRSSPPSRSPTCSPSTTRARRGATLLTTDQLDPAGYGRIVRDGDGNVERIVETKHTGRRHAGGARHPRDQPRHLRLRGADALRRRSTSVGPSRRRALPHRRLPAACAQTAPRSSPAHDRRRRRRPRRQRPRRPDGGRGRSPSAASSRATPAPA